MCESNWVDGATEVSSRVYADEFNREKYNVDIKGVITSNSPRIDYIRGLKAEHVILYWRRH